MTNISFEINLNEDDGNNWDEKLVTKITERWSLPYFSCPASKWLQSYSVLIKGDTSNRYN